MRNITAAGNIIRLELPDEVEHFGDPLGDITEHTLSQALNAACWSSGELELRLAELAGKP